MATVYYSHNTKTGANVAPAAGVLALHKDSLKKIWKLSSADFDRVCVMLDTGAEPDVGEPLRTEYWELKKVFERSLRTEMYLGDQEELFFEHNLPRNKDTWSGTFLVCGNSGAGKTRWVVDLFLRYMRATKAFNRRTLIYISPEWGIDRTVKPLKDKRFAFNVIGIDVRAGGSQKRARHGLLLQNQDRGRSREARREGDHRVRRLHGCRDRPRAFATAAVHPRLANREAQGNLGGFARTQLRVGQEHEPGDTVGEVRRLLPKVPSQPHRDVHEGSPAPVHARGKRTGRPVREARPMDDYSHAQSCRPVQLKVPAPALA